MIKSYKPTSNGMRFRKTLVLDITKNKKREKKLSSPLKGPAGRNNGTVSSRHRQRGHKKHYRVIDFKRDKRDIPAKVMALEYDPNRGANIALVSYADGEKRYILAPEKLKVGTKVIAGDNVEPVPGNALPLANIPLGAPIHNIEINPGKGGQMVRGAGNSAILMAKEGKYVNIKLPSGEIKKVLKTCYATMGVLSNADLRNTQMGKAGRARHKGKRPHIRGIAIANPSDHPHGGSYKDNGIGMPSPKSPWGWKTRGKLTRKRKHTDKFIVKSRRKKR
ncbi:MAG: 50S ribosomal protein L2 [Patescibacteria group bacterium]